MSDSYLYRLLYIDSFILNRSAVNFPLGSVRQALLFVGGVVPPWSNSTEELALGWLNWTAGRYG